MADSTSAVAEAEMTLEEIKNLNVFQRLHAIMTELKPLAHDKTVKMRGTGGKSEKDMYGYTSHDAVSLAVRPLLSKYRVQVLPSVGARQDNTNRCELDVNVTFVNIDSPDDRTVIQSVGYGVDPSDKGPGKALSYATKYAYLKVFCLNAGDDIEEQDMRHEPATATATQMLDTIERSKDAMRVAANNLKLAIEGAKTVAEVKDLSRENKDMLSTAPAVTKEYFLDLMQARIKEIEENGV